jgi:CheY-like chemotaxis protein
MVVRLPAAAAPALELAPASATPPSVGGARRRILVADDNRDAAMSLAMILEMQGNETRVAHDGADALAAARTFKPHVALLDIGMPKLNGFDVARRIRTEDWGKAVALVAVTGWGQDEIRRRSHEAGFDHHLVKPVEPDALVELLREME